MTADVEFLTIGVMLDLQDVGSTLSTQTRALATFDRQMLPLYVTKTDRTVSWANKKICLLSDGVSTYLGIGPERTDKLDYKSSGDDVLFTQLDIILNRYKKNQGSLPGFFPQKEIVGTNANQAVGKGSSLDDAVIQFNRNERVLNIVIAYFEDIDDPSMTGYSYADFPARGSKYKVGDKRSFGDPSILQLKLIITEVEVSRTYELESTSAQLYESAKNLTNKWSEFQLQSNGFTVLQHFEKLLIGLFGIGAQSTLNKDAVRRAIMHAPPVQDTRSLPYGNIVHNVMTEEHWNNSSSAVAGKLRFRYNYNNGKITGMLDDISELMMRLNIQSSSGVASTLIRLKLTLMDSYRAPRVTAISATKSIVGPSPGFNESIITFELDENTTVSDADQVKCTLGGHLTNLLSVDGGKKYTATFTANENYDSATITVEDGAFKDTHENASVTTTKPYTITIDRITPYIDLVNPSVFTVGAVGTVLLTFSLNKVTTIVSESQVRCTGGGKISTLSKKADGKTYTTIFKADGTDSIAKITFEAGAFQDINGNLNRASPISCTVTIR